MYKMFFCTHIHRSLAGSMALLTSGRSAVLFL